MILSAPIFAQWSVEVSDANNTVYNEGVLTKYASPGTDEMSTYLKTTFSGPSTNTVNVKRYELDVQPGTGNYFCWGLCYGEVSQGVNVSWISGDPVSMDPGVEYNYFAAYHKPHNNVGVSCYRYVWYDLNNEDDSTWVDICFDTESVGINEAEGLTNLDVYPNPSNGDVTFDLAFNPVVRNAAITVHNLLGEEVWSREVKGLNAKVQMPGGHLNSGVYFYSISTNGRIATTEKLIITK